MKIANPGVEATKRLEELEQHQLASYALRSADRRSKLGDKFRQYNKESPLEYRTEYHRDRDRIVWSKSFKRLQHKTQIFPYYVEDAYRRRLTHSIEVAQIATTLARALRLNEVATEAMALGHDLGHTPFGHAGERALNEVLRSYSHLEGSRSPLPVPLFGFDHCVQAIEVIARIEDEYLLEAKHPGLNLTHDVQEGILKHMYDRNKKDETHPHSRVADVVGHSEYAAFGVGKGSLEAQCVYFADKLAYLLSDIEDGIRCTIFDPCKLAKTRFLKKIWGMYNEKRAVPTGIHPEDLQDFARFRRKALTVFILNCIEQTTGKLSGISSYDDVANHGERLVWVSDDLAKGWHAFYREWLTRRLFRHHRLIACNYKAMTIVKDLFSAYMDQLGLIPWKYRDNSQKAYEPLVGDAPGSQKIMNLITVRNYLAGCTDAYAIDQHERLFSASERIL